MLSLRKYIESKQINFMYKIIKSNTWKNGKHSFMNIFNGNKFGSQHWNNLSVTQKNNFNGKLCMVPFFTEHKLFLMNVSTGLCHFCRANTETLTHLFYHCAIVNCIGHALEAKINDILEVDSQLKIKIFLVHLVLVFLHENSHFRKFVNFIIILMKWEI